MLPSLYSAISGLRANQKKLDVIGNNIANASTTSFKTQTVNFKDMLSQNIGEAVGGGATTGGINAKQVGLGVQIGAINTLTNTGDMESTGSDLDAAIDGEGYFMVGKGNLPTTNTNGVTIASNGISNANGMDVMYTRDGSFALDNSGNLLTSDGYRVLGYALSASGSDSISYSGGTPTVNFVKADDANLKAGSTLVPLVIPDSVKSGSNTLQVKSFTIGTNGLITAVLSDGSVTALGQIAEASFKNDAGLTKLGSNLYQNSANSGAAIIRSGVGATTDNGTGYGDILQGVLEMSNVDLAQQFTDMIVATRAFEANGKIITTGDTILEDLINLKR